MATETKWEERNRRQCEDNYRLFRLKANQEAREARNEKSLAQRVQKVRGILHQMQETGAASIGRSSPSAESQRLPHELEEELGGLSHLHPQETRELIEGLDSGEESVRSASAEALEGALDAHRGFLRLEANATGDERDDRILQAYEGCTPAEIAKLEPSLGKAKAIKEVRIKHNRNPIDGTPND